MKLKPLSQQVMVITGASSGIGLTTARMAAEAGARLVLAARNTEALDKIVGDINDKHGDVAIAVGADVAKEEDLKRVAERAVERFGGFDTWINNAGVSIYGRVIEVPLADHRKLFETNFWGVVNGSRIACGHFAEAGQDRDGYGFALINLGSALSDRAIPLQGMYCASKHAVKGFTEALRMEVEQAGLPISMTVIKPAAIDTPYRQHAKNYMDAEPLNPPPVYAPEVVARGILHSAQHPTRDLFIGHGGKQISLLGYYLPRATDWVMEKLLFGAQKGKNPPQPIHQNALHAPMEDGDQRGGYGKLGIVREHSAYTQATMHPLVSGMVVMSAGLIVGGIVAAMNRKPATTTQRLKQWAGM